MVGLEVGGLALNTNWLMMSQRITTYAGLSCNFASAWPVANNSVAIEIAGCSPHKAALCKIVHLPLKLNSVVL